MLWMLWRLAAQQHCQKRHLAGVSCREKPKILLLGPGQMSAPVGLLFCYAVPAFSFTGEKANQNDFEKKVTGKWPLANFGERLMAVCKFDHDTVHGSKNSNINMKCLMCGSWE